MRKDIILKQTELCKKHKVESMPSLEEGIIGVSKNLNSGQMPINGLRHKPENGTSGWYIWAGDYSEDPNFFEPIHTKHLEEKYPLVLKYLGLPPGWRFQIDNNGYEDVWEDKRLLEI